MSKAKRCRYYSRNMPSLLTLTIKDLEEIGGLAKCCPPLRDEKEVEQLLGAVANGEIDDIASDHLHPQA
jgi:allantoinase